MRRVVFLFVSLLVAAPAAAQPLAEATDGAADSAALYVVFGGIIVLLVLMLGLMIYQQRKLLSACTKTNRLELLVDLPMGIPRGSVRSLLALTIVFASLAYIAYFLVGTPNANFPDIVGTILGTVLGFYFGSRSAAEAGEERTEKLVESARAEGQEAAAEATAEKEQSVVGNLAGKARQGVAIARTVAGILPEQMGSQVKKVAGFAEEMLGVAESLSGAGRTGEAKAKLQDVIQVAKDPVANVLGNALDAMRSVLGTAVPVAGIALAVISISAKVTGAAYDRWVARVMGAPHTPELFPPALIDADSAIMIIRRIPALAAAYAPELAAGDRDFFRRFKDEALSPEGLDAVAADPAFRKDLDDDELAAAVMAFQREIMDEEVRKEVAPDLAQAVGGLPILLAHLDKLHKDSRAREELQKLMLVTDELKRAGQPVDKVFSEAAQDLKA